MESPVGNLESNNGHISKKQRIASPSLQLTPVSPAVSPASSIETSPEHFDKTLLNEKIRSSFGSSTLMDRSLSSLEHDEVSPKFTLTRSKSEGMAIKTGLENVVDTLTEEYIISLKKSLSSIKFILEDIIFEYKYEIDIVGRARDRIIAAQDAAGQGRRE